MAAKVTITVTPWQFDTIREAIKEAIEANKSIRQDRNIDAKTRNDALQTEARYSDVYREITK